MDEARRRVRFQTQVFGALWVAYASYYLCRMNLAAAQPALLKEFPAWTTAQIGLIPSIYSVFYAVGQFVSGQLASRFGGRRMVALGMAVIVVANLLFSQAHSLPVMMALWALNGLAQSTGWPALVQAMSHWFTKGRRGTVMGFISTCYQVGNVLSWLLAGFLVDAYGWRAAFWVPGLALLPVLVLAWVLLRDRPEDVGLAHIRDDDASPAGSATTTIDAGEWTLAHVLKVTLSNRTLWLVAGTYFFFNAVRYAFMNWSIQYFADFHHQEIKHSALKAIAFPLVGALGAVSSGWVSDVLFGGKRAPVCAAMLSGLALLCVGFVPLAAGSTLTATLLLAAAGFMIYGPDAIISGATAIDVAHPKAAAAASGFVMAMGNLGSALVAGFGVGFILDQSHGAWGPVFITLAVLAALSAGMMTLLWNAGQQKANLP